jgi:hypothetical protein
MKTILLASAALLLAAAPAEAQLLGGVGGLGAGVGGVLAGHGSLDMPMSTVTNSTRGTLDSAVRTSGDQSIDRRSGHVKARRNADARGSGALDQATATPIGGLTGSGAAGAPGSAAAGGEAQLIGADAVRATAGQAMGSARALAGQATGTVAGAAATAAGSASGGAWGALSGGSGQLALAGSAAAQGAGFASVAPGMGVVDSAGNAIGSVRQVVADARGRVQQVLVTTDEGTALLPAANFSAAGNLLVSGMSQGKVEKTARRQAKR